MNGGRRKVFLVQGIIPSYRVPVFRRLAELDDVDLTVFYSDSSKVQQIENLKSSDRISGFRHIKLPLIEFRSGILQFGILPRIYRERPDVFIGGQMGRTDMLMALFLCKLLGIRVLWFQGGVPYIDPEKIREYAMQGRMNRWFGRYNPRRLLSLLADGLVVYTDHAKQFYRDMGFAASRIWVAHNSTDTDALKRYREEWLAHPEILEGERNRFSPEGNPIILLIGRLNVARRVETLLHALKLLYDDGVRASFVVVGDGGERQAFSDLADSLCLQNVYFEGAVYDERELCRYLLVSDIFVVPGIASLALKMAMAMGRPVVAADYGLEVHDIEEGVNGFVFPLGDEQALAATLKPLLVSEDLMKEIGSGGLATVREKINIHEMIEGFRRAIFNEAPRDMSGSGGVHP